jgi:hypothetical protein
MLQLQHSQQVANQNESAETKVWHADASALTMPIAEESVRRDFVWLFVLRLSTETSLTDLFSDYRSLVLCTRIVICEFAHVRVCFRELSDM